MGEPAFFWSTPRQYGFARFIWVMLPPRLDSGSSFATLKPPFAMVSNGSGG